MADLKEVRLNTEVLVEPQIVESSRDFLIESLLEFASRPFYLLELFYFLLESHLDFY